MAPPLGHGRYRLTEVLGAGGMAVVYKAFDARLDVARAVKVLNPSMDDHARIRFFNEARTMAKLHHKHVVTVHDVADDGDRTYLVMELIEGGSIADRMAAYGPLPVKMACQVTMALLDGLHAAHLKGIVHRDVKPHNVLVGQDGLPKVTDFGIASVADYSSTKTGAVIGTWAYMAPEQRSDSKGVDARADVFGAGCALYNMVTGIDPFDLYNLEAYDEKYGPVPEALRPLIQQATRYKAEDRYESADAFRAALEALLAELPEDPEGTPPLGVGLGERRAEIVPTLVAHNLERSSPTLSAIKPRPKLLEPVPEPEPEPDRLVPWLGALAAVLVLILIGGAVLGLLVVAGIVVVGTTDATTVQVVEPAPDPVPAEPAPSVPVPSEPAPSEPAPSEPAPSEPAPSEPAPSEPAQPEAGVPEPVEPAPVVRSEPVAPVQPIGPGQPAPARPIPEPRPTANPKKTGFPVRVKTIPEGNISINGTWYKSGEMAHFASGTVLEVVYEANGEQARLTRPLNGPLDLCFDFHNDKPCPVH